MLYLDEVAGYMPPVANPPSKQALLLLMKQARAFGLGVVLATQNPIDIDYKGLSNAGTWFLGRLQTERDKARLLDGLEGALQGQGHTFDRGETERILSSLQKRTFFLHDVHDVPMDSLEPNPRLAEQLRRLPGRCYVFTNGARDYAGRVLDRLGVADCFEGVFAIEDADLTPKPAPSTFRRVVERFGFEPRTAAFFEDTPRNLEPAKVLGMATILIGDGHGKPLGDHIDHIAPELTDFLTGLTFKDVAA
jgi:HAD superfamily hydrolase (TIGR01509 family)